MTTRSTPGTSAQRSAAVARASSASSSTIGQRTRPSASIARSASGNWASSSRRHARLGLVARVQVVAERADDPVRGAADVGRALVAEQVEQLLDEARHAGQRDRRPGRGPAGAARSGPGTARRSRRRGGPASSPVRAAQASEPPTSSTPAAAISSSARCPSPAARSTARIASTRTAVAKPSVGRVERRRLDAVVGGQPAHDDPLDARGAQQRGELGRASSRPTPGRAS